MDDAGYPRPKIKGLWPVRFLPHEDELITSWLLRLAWSNGRKLQRFLFELVPDRSVHYISQDLDWDIPSVLLLRLAKSIKVSKETIARHTLKSIFMEHLFLSEDHPTNKQWLLPSKLEKKPQIGSFVMYCPECLAEGQYIRKHWRYSWSTVCLKHKCVLVDKCDHCGSFFDYRANDSGEVESQSLYEGSVAKCRNCNQPAYPFAPIPKTVINKCDLQVHHYIRHAFNRGKIGRSDCWVYSLPLLNCLREMAACLFRNKEQEILLYCLSKLGNVESDFADSRPVFGRQFNAQCVETRTLVIRILALLFKDFPNEFLKFSRKFNLRSSSWIRREGSYIYPIRVSIDELNHTWYRYSFEEFQSVKNYLERNNFPTTDVNIRRWLGKHYQDLEYIQEYRKMDKQQF